MIVCHCNRIDHLEIEEACSALLTEDPLRMLTPVAVYKALGKRPRCGGCLGLAANLIHTRDADASDRCRNCPCPMALFEHFEASVEVEILAVEVAVESVDGAD